MVMESRPLAIWTIALAICLAVRVGLGGTGEFICTILLVTATSVRFGFGRNATGNENEDAAPIPAEAYDDEPSQSQRDESSPEQEGNLSLQLISRKGDESTPPDDEPDVEEDPSQLSPADTAIAEVPIPVLVPVPVPVPRSAYLDNVKSFLTALVMTHHVNCAFGGCGPNTWYLIVGLGRGGPFTSLLGAMALLDQCFFMSLFFFISACFVPSSYARKGWCEFREGRKRRILFPALFTVLITTPACIAWGGYIAGAETLAYYPYPGVAWFLFWLLLFNWMYATMTSGPEVETEPSAPSERRKFPGTVSRLLCGMLVCGLALIPFLVLTPGTLASMPMAPGSATCDFLMFYLGVQAQKHGWLESSLSDQMDVSPALLTLMVVVEGAGVVLLLPIIEKNALAGLGFICLAGVFCLDMSLLVLVAFQRYLDTETPLTKFFARAAYGVYLTHPLVVTGMTALYIWICNQLGVTIETMEIGNEKEEGAPVGTEGGDQYLIGWILVNLASHLFVWPLAWHLTRLPVLKNIL